MGGTTFDHYASGVDVNDAFNRAREEAGYESGHGGYSGTIVEKGDFTIITRTPLLESEARTLADRLVESNDPRISDKWGPAGAIPIVKSTRTVEAKDFTYTPTAGHREYGPDPALLEAVSPLVKLRKGETIAQVEVYSHTQPQVSNYGYSRAPSRVRSKCQARVIINKPPATRKAPLLLEIPANMNWEQKNKEVGSQVEKMRLKVGESIISWTITKDTPGKAKVTAVAPKGATLTRFVVKGSRAHGTWETGFASQSEARAWATDTMNDESFRWEDCVTWEVESATRRVDGSPLVQLVREVGKRMIDVEVEVKLASASTATPSSPDGWLFFGWSSC